MVKLWPLFWIRRHFTRFSILVFRNCGVSSRFFELIWSFLSILVKNVLMNDQSSRSFCINTVAAETFILGLTFVSYFHQPPSRCYPERESMLMTRLFTPGLTVSLIFSTEWNLHLISKMNCNRILTGAKLASKLLSINHHLSIFLPSIWLMLTSKRVTFALWL